MSIALFVSSAAPPPSVLTCPQSPQLGELLGRFGLNLVWITDQAPIPGSFWGEPEAGLVRDALLVRQDTPLHSALHEAGHYVCMDATRRDRLHTNAGGDDLEENAVCYLQILLAAQLPGIGRRRLFEDMDAWGYSFRLGSTRAWFERDADDARQWLLEHGLIDTEQMPTWRLRQVDPPTLQRWTAQR